MKKILTLVLSLAIGVSFVGCSSKAAEKDKDESKASSKTKVENTISFPKGYDIKSSGASSYANSGDHEDSPYFKDLDVYNMKSSDTLTVIPKFKTYQQTTEYTCGPVSALMVLEHYGEKGNEELKIADIMQSNKDINGNNKEKPGVANEKGEYGTSTAGMVKFFDQIGWNVTSSLTEADKDGYSFTDPEEFKNWVIKNLKNETPIMIEWIDWAGHWQDIIGYDTMGTDDFGDDVIIFADAYDTSDHNQDGYYIYPAERFFYMWQDRNVLPDDHAIQQWVIAEPKE
nr:C39 family peptidase [Clostridioides sp.]